jgi:hypothetical protein
MTEDTFTTAYQLHTFGYSVIPSGGGDKGKLPLVEWAQYQTGQPTDEQMYEWRDTYSPRLWGIVTNSTVGVLDADTTEVRTELEAELGSPHVSTPRGGGHWYINTTGHPFPTKAGILPDIDTRGPGGFCNIVGSSALGEYRILTLPRPDTLIPLERVPERILAALNNRKPVAIEDGEPIPEGRRNDTLTSIAGTLRAKGLTQTAIEAGLLGINTAQCHPPLPKSEVEKIAKSIATYPSNSGINNTSLYCPSSATLATEGHKAVTEKVTNPEPLAKRIRDWVTNTSGWFSYDDIDREFEIRSSTDKHNRWMILRRLRDEGILESHLSNNKLLRHIKVATRLVDFKACGNRTPLAIKYPFGIERYFNTYPGNLIVLAGAADAGKTAFLLNLIKLNMADFSTFYQTSEMGAEELASRLEKFEGMALEDWNFVAEERSRDFHDVIRPDCLNVVDYLELAGDFYMVAEYLRQIHSKLASGIAVVALQKKRDAPLGRGGDFGLEKPRLYLSMDAGKLTIEKAKNWVDHETNPRGMTIGFKIVNGCQFIVSENWHRRE